MADDKISTNVNDNTLNINITSNNQVENNTKPVMSINQALKNTKSVKEIQDAKKVDPTDLNKKKVTTKPEEKQNTQTNIKEIEVLQEISQTLTSLKDATINFKTEVATSFKDISPDKKDDKNNKELFSSYLSEGFIESFQNRIIQRNLSDIIEDALKDSLTGANVNDEFLTKLKASLNEIINESSYFINKDNKTSDSEKLIEQNVQSLKLVNDYLKETQNNVNNKTDDTENADKFEAALNANADRNAEALSVATKDEIVNQLNNDLKQQYADTKQQQETLKDVLEKIDNDINSSTEVKNENKVEKETEEIDKGIDENLKPDYALSENESENVDENDKNLNDVVLNELSEKFVVDQDELDGFEELLNEKFEEFNKNVNITLKNEEEKSTLLKTVVNRLSNPPKQENIKKEQLKLIDNRQQSNDVNKISNVEKSSSIAASSLTKVGTLNEQNKPQVNEKSTIQTTKTSKDESNVEKNKKIEIISKRQEPENAKPDLDKKPIKFVQQNIPEKQNITEKVQVKATPMMVNKRQNTIANRERESSLERLVEVLKNTNMNNAKETIKVGGDKKSGASIISLLSGIQNIVGSFLEIYKQTAEEQRAAALYKQKFGSEKSSKFNINLKQQKERPIQKSSGIPKRKEGQSVWGWLIGSALVGLWAVTKFLGKGILNALWKVTMSVIKAVGKALWWLTKVLVKDLGKLLKWVGGVLWKGLSFLGKGIGKAFKWIGGIVKNVLPKLVNVFKGVFNKILNPIGNFIGKFGGKIFGFFKGAFTKILGPIANLISNLLGKLFGGIGGKLGKLGNGVSDLFESSSRKLTRKAVIKGAGKTAARGGAKIAGNVATKAVTKGATKIAGKTALRIGAGALKAIPGINAIATVGMAAFDAVDGWKNAASITGKAEKDLTIADKAKAAGASALSGLTFGLVSSQTMYKGINAVINFRNKMFKGIGSGIGKLFKVASGGKGIGGLIKNSIKYSPIGLAAAGAKQLFGWMTGDNAKKKVAETKRKKIEEMNKNIQFSKNVGAGMVRFTPIVSLLREIVSIMKGDIGNDNLGPIAKTFEIDKSNTTPDRRNAKVNLQNTQSKITNIQTSDNKLQVTSAKTSNDKSLNKISNSFNDMRDSKNRIANEQKEMNSAENTLRKNKEFLMLLRPVITAAVADAFAFAPWNNGKSIFNKSKSIFVQDDTDESTEMGK